MKYIKKYNTFNDELYVFDLDDTLVKTPSFESVAKKYINESNLPSVYELLNKSVDLIDMNIKDLKWENGRIFIQNDNIKPIGNWVKKKTRLYLTTPDIYSYIDESMPFETNTKILEIYNSVSNKVILTARPEGTRNKIEKTINKLGINYPEYGLLMRPDKMKNAGRWKGEQLVKLSENFDNIIFYDDNSKYIKEARKVWNDKALFNKSIKFIKVI